MICPACKAPLIVLEHEQVEIDYCATCKGVWLDAQELVLLFGDADADAAFLSGGEPTATSEARRRCPLCHRRMDKRATAGEHSVIFDRCRRGHGVWFDEGELATVLEHGHVHDTGDRLATFLRELFPVKQKT